MHTVVWTFKIPSHMSKADVVKIVADSAHTYQGVPGLIRKYYGVTENASELVGMYLWESLAAANAFYTPQWRAKVEKRWESPARRQDWETPMVVEAAQGRLIAAE